jgi:hypothetical protein
MHLLLHPPQVLKPPSWALVHKITYAPMIYTALFLMRAYPLLGQVGGGWALEFSSFLGPIWHSPIGSMPFHRAQKTLEFQGPIPSHLPLYCICMHPKHYVRGCINHRCINSYYVSLFQTHRRLWNYATLSSKFNFHPGKEDRDLFLSLYTKQ